MERAASCLVCGETITKRRKGVVAPFLAHRIWDRKPFAVELLECQACQFKFYNPRLGDEEQGKLYAGYRESQYQQLRHSFEPWYTERFNASLSSPETVRRRRAIFARIFSEHIRPCGVRSVLDFGGARGELVQNLIPGGEACVYDISSVEPLPGVQKRSLQDCISTKGFDLIVTSNVLEHVSSPRQFLGQIASIASEGTLVFVEVPWESPSGCAAWAKRLVQHIALGVARPKVTLSLLEVGALTVMHEHVNFFAPVTLERLMVSMQWKVIAGGVYRFGNSPLAGRIIWSLARAPLLKTSPNEESVA
jgi:2-polyprenyl-3-methyl-5-hydroxy-6-metoxy-1,4-benzoquinol methylase